MSSIGTGYDFSASQFSPEGRVFQVEYAQKACENSGTVVALRGKNSIVLSVEGLGASKLMEPGANQRIFHIDKHAGIAASGLICDARQVVENARSEASSYRSQYGCSIPILYLDERVAMHMHAYTLYSAVRPFGCSVIIGGYDHNGPVLYMIEPSGVSFGYNGCAIGKAKEAAKTEIEKLATDKMSMKELAKEAARIIYLVHDEVKDKSFELEMTWAGAETNGIHERVPPDVLEEMEKSAKECIADTDSSDSDEI